MGRLVLVVGLVGAALAAAAAEEGAAAGEETKVCPGCGETIPASAVFCPHCHRYFPDAKGRMVTCPECGAEVVATETICPKCGAIIKRTPPRTTAAEPETQAPPAYRPVRDTRFSGRFRAGAMVTEGHTVPSGAVILGARFSDEVAVGGGLGYQSYPNATSVPLFLTARAFFNSGVIEPAVFGEVGYNIAKLKESWPGAYNASGFLVGVGLGLDIVFYRGFGWTLDVGGRMEMSKEYYRYANSQGELSPVYDRSVQDIYFVGGSGMTF